MVTLLGKLPRVFSKGDDEGRGLMVSTSSPRARNPLCEVFSPDWRVCIGCRTGRWGVSRACRHLRLLLSSLLSLACSSSLSCSSYTRTCSSIVWSSVSVDWALPSRRLCSRSLRLRDKSNMNGREIKARAMLRWGCEGETYKRRR